MERICAVMVFEYHNDSKPIEIPALFDCMEDIEHIVDYVERVMDEQDPSHGGSVILTPYNPDINGEYIAVNCVVSLRYIKAMKCTCSVIKYEEPLDVSKS